MGFMLIGVDNFKDNETDRHSCHIGYLGSICLPQWQGGGIVYALLLS